MSVKPTTAPALLPNQAALLTQTIFYQTPRLSTKQFAAVGAILSLISCSSIHTPFADTPLWKTARSPDGVNKISEGTPLAAKSQLAERKPLLSQTSDRDQFSESGTVIMSMRAPDRAVQNVSNAEFPQSSMAFGVLNNLANTQYAAESRSGSGAATESLLFTAGPSTPVPLSPVSLTSTPLNPAPRISAQLDPVQSAQTQPDGNTSVAAILQNGVPQRLAPLIGYFPPALGYIPAENETWIELNKTDSTMTVYKGQSVVKAMTMEGNVSLAPGDYFLQLKQKDPLWHAPDNYFTKRQLHVPGDNDRLRYRRGAYGKFVLFPTPTFPIHSAAIWTDDVGGVRVSEEDLRSVFLMIPLGTPVVVR